MRSEAGDAFDRLPLIPVVTEDGAVEPGQFEVLLFDLQEPIDYFVESIGVESPAYRLDVIELPYAERIELEYHFPEYTGLEPRTVDDGGDIAVLQGTEVRLRAVPTMGTTGGQLVFDDDDDQRFDLALEDDGTLTASFMVEEEGFYRVDLVAPAGNLVTASPQYTIDVLTDQPPSAMFIRPGRDTTASAIEEVFIEARADDDFGLHSLDLVYSVNGGPEESVSLFDGGGNPLRRSPRATRSSSRSWSWSRATSSRTTRGRPTATCCSRAPTSRATCSSSRSGATTRTTGCSRRRAAPAARAAWAGPTRASSPRRSARSSRRPSTWSATGSSTTPRSSRRTSSS